MFGEREIRVTVQEEDVCRALQDILNLPVVKKVEVLPKPAKPEEALKPYLAVLEEACGETRLSPRLALQLRDVVSELPDDTDLYQIAPYPFYRADRVPEVVYEKFLKDVSNEDLHSVHLAFKALRNVFKNRIYTIGQTRQALRHKRRIRKPKIVGVFREAFIRVVFAPKN